MSEIESFPFNKDSFERVRSYKFGRNWPVVYIIENKQEAYIGQSTNAYYRSIQHYERPERRKLETIHVLSDEEFNMSASFDIESLLIQYMAADGKFLLQNGNGGMKNHNYYDRIKYRTKFERLWNALKTKGLVEHSLDFIKNTDLFKYSPYKSLTDDQLEVARLIVKDIKSNANTTFLVHGKPGTGKTILATYLCKYLLEHEETKQMTLGLVVPMSSLRSTISRVFGKIKGLRSSMVIGPNDVVKKPYDLLIIDESHRLQRRKGIMGYGSFDKVNEKLGLPQSATQLDWIMRSSRFQIFMYDEFQSIKPADIRSEDFKELNKREFVLKSQMRVGAGDAFVTFIDDIFSARTPKLVQFENYDFKLFEDIHEMVLEIKAKDHLHKLCRVVSGYAWPWHTKPGTKSDQDYDIQIDGLKLIWNSTTKDWVNSKNALNEVGCIHTIQGYDLNYVGVIIGPEFGYDPIKKRFVVNRNQYFDTNGRKGISDPLELELYIKNIYKTLLTRGILGTYVYVVDEHLRFYLKGILQSNSSQEKVEKIDTIVRSPYDTGRCVKVVLYDSVGCGEAVYADSESGEEIDVPEWLIKPGAKYFALRTRGDSMNQLGVEDGDIILCQKNYQASSGSNAVVLIGDDATLKQIRYENDGLVLIPKSNNPKHPIRKLTERDEEFKVLGIFVCRLDNQ
ncbi:MAG: hypothetical protein RLZZ70_602 [Candidatus Parcubacteria bacterium]|jgi:DUF2075 family protein/SOS-response transcriptional repressor LexA/DNA replication protein DnaC